MSPQAEGRRKELRHLAMTCAGAVAILTLGLPSESGCLFVLVDRA
jgi:hypothetical protein